MQVSGKATNTSAPHDQQQKANLKIGLNSKRFDEKKEEAFCVLQCSEKAL